jgi:hypothetical protein
MADKRMRPADADWTIAFDDAADIRAVVDSVAAVLQRATYKVVAAGPQHYTLKVDGADLGMTCCVAVRLRIERENVRVRDGGERIEFCVDCKQVQTALDAAACVHAAIELQGRDDGVLVVVTDPETRTEIERSELKTFVDNETPTEFVPLDFATRIEIDIPRLKEVIKKARAWHSERLRVRIFLRDEGSVHRSLVEFVVEGDAKYTQKFYNEATRDEDGSLRIRAVTEGGGGAALADGAPPHFEGVFLLDKIEAFVKILPKQMVLADVSAGMPIMLSHQLGGNADDADSRIRFLVAPVNDEE